MFFKNTKLCPKLVIWGWGEGLVHNLSLSLGWMLTFSTLAFDIWGQAALCCGYCPAHCKRYSNLPVCTQVPAVPLPFSWDNQRCLWTLSSVPWGDTVTLVGRTWAKVYEEVDVCLFLWFCQRENEVAFSVCVLKAQLQVHAQV